MVCFRSRRRAAGFFVCIAMLAACGGKKDEGAAKKGDDGYVDPSIVNKPVEADSPDGVTTVKEYSFEPAKMLDPVPGAADYKSLGKKRWRRHVAQVVEQFKAILELDYIVLGGGNAKKLGELPPGARLGANTDAFVGGFRLWEKL